MDEHRESSLLVTPLGPREKTPRWIYKKLIESRARPILERIASLAVVRLTRAMIIKEFFGHRIMPLKSHSRPLWDSTDMGDPIRLHVNNLTYDELDGAFGALLGR
ncbi:hypothetical protein D1007_42346 [Hordeum vulgare]|nr:hypothetical protein D1007_42346 [Hordeum vulgare]